MRQQKSEPMTDYSNRFSEQLERVRRQQQPTCCVLEGSSDIGNVLIGSMMCKPGSLINGFVEKFNDGGQREDGIWNHKGVQSTTYSSNILSQGQNGINPN